MPEERLSAAETVALPRADFDFTNEVVALCTVVAYALVSTNGSTAAVAAVVAPPSVRGVGRTAAVPAVAPQTRVLAVRRASTVPAVGAHASMQAHACAAAVRAVAALTTVGAFLVRPGRRSTVEAPVPPPPVRTLLRRPAHRCHR